MPTRVASKGKKRAVSDVIASLGDTEADLQDAGRASTSSLSPPAESRPAKRPKRAETRQCPICAEHIPLRLLAQHSALETQRVHAVLARVGDLEVWSDPHASASSTSTARRRSAILPPSTSSTDRLTKTIIAFKKRRKQRNQLLRDVTHDEEDGSSARKGKDKARASETCPICERQIFGDLDVINAHVDSCIAHATIQEATNVTPPPDPNLSLDVDVDGGVHDGDPWEESTAPDGVARLRLRFGGASAQRLGFVVRAPRAADVEEEVDVDGDDIGVFGEVQFTEADVLTPSLESVPTITEHTDAPPAVEGGVGCRICLDAYVEPTVSTGCWHTCCRGCWLRCLGSTGLCPICKRITAATDLRRIYL